MLLSHAGDLRSLRVETGTRTWHRGARTRRRNAQIGACTTSAQAGGRHTSTSACTSVGTIQSPWVPYNAFIQRDGFWGFTDFKAAGTMPDFDYAADVIVSAEANGRSSMAPTAFSFNNKFTGEEINSNFGWPDCGSGCTFWSNDPDGFGHVANAAELTYDASSSVHDGYV